ncbi:Hypothetical protein CINCED_3A002148 [Cinara cedri]|uniref:Uncharacterized protein n=1 Tax=Cinara cedri TaxID=506608 RepID=A0A5E4MZ71_9HEMI|nr:Hypothetical protein CINCED_3A002148 [Cinara cedri]
MYSCIASILLKCITAKLKEKAEHIINYRNIDSWGNIRKYLLEAVETKFALSILQLQLNHVKMCSGKDKDETKLIREQFLEQLSAAYMKGLIGLIKSVVKAQNPETLEQTKLKTKAEELERQEDIEEQHYFNQPRESPQVSAAIIHDVQTRCILISQSITRMGYLGNMDEEKNTKLCAVLGGIGFYGDIDLAPLRRRRDLRENQD